MRVDIEPKAEGANDQKSPREVEPSPAVGQRSRHYCVLHVTHCTLEADMVARLLLGKSPVR
eukprot:9415233-Pyramimonas_sp.AAC.1